MAMAKSQRAQHGAGDEDAPLEREKKIKKNRNITWVLYVREDYW
jgi:hypothetical protein